MKYLLPCMALIASCSALMANDIQNNCNCETVVYNFESPEGDSRIQFGGSYTYAHIMTDGYSSDHGHLGGAQAMYEYRAPNRVYGAASFAWRQGLLKGSERNVFLHDYDAQERIGYTFANCQDTARVSLYTGLGYRHLTEKNTVADAATVFFNYDEFYVPVGLAVEGQFNSIVSMGFNAQWMPQVYSNVTAKPLSGARWKTVNKLDNFQLELPITFSIRETCTFAISFVPFYQFWHDGHTTAVSASGVALNIPENTYQLAGAKVNLCFSF